MTRSSSKCGLWSCKEVVSAYENLWTMWHWLSALCFYVGFVHGESVNEIATEVVYAETEKKLRLEVDQVLLNCVMATPRYWTPWSLETKIQSSQWRSSPRPKKARQIRCNVKIMFIVFFHSCGMVHEYALQGTDMTKEGLVAIIRRLGDASRRKRVNVWAKKTGKLRHDKAPAHSSHLIHLSWPITTFICLVRLPTLQTLLICDFWLFHKLEMSLKETQSESREDIVRNPIAELHSVPKEPFMKCF